MQACKPIRNARKLHFLWQLAGRWAGDVTGETSCKSTPYGPRCPPVPGRVMTLWICCQPFVNRTFTLPNACIRQTVFTHLPIHTYYTRYRYGASKIDPLLRISKSAAIQRLMQSHRTHNLYLPTKQHERRRDWTNSNLEIACITFYASIGSWSFGSILESLLECIPDKQ